MFHGWRMETITIRELRQNWPGVERRLRATREPLLVTRDGEPVAQILPPTGAVAGARPAFSVAAHRAWRAGRWGGRAPKTNSAGWLTRETEERAVGQQ